MTEDIPFDKSFDLAAGHVDEPVPGVRRILANNPGPFTFKGTMSYIVGRGRVAIIDPGPDDPRHIAALLNAVRGETVTHIFVTHTHRDHSPAVPAVKAATGAEVLSEGPHRPARPLNIGETQRLEASNDLEFSPDRKLADGEIVSGAGWTIEAITTPGHTANHMAFALKEADVLFSGDHVMAWSTSIVAPPRHRQGREASILHRLGKGPADIPTLVRAIYIGIDPRLVGAAGLSVLAHLEDLVARGAVATDAPPSIGGTYRLPA